MGQLHIYELMECLRLESKPGSQITPDARSVNFKCPICGHRGYTLNISFEKDTFKCPQCGAKGGAIELYSQVRFGESYSKGTERAEEIRRSLKQDLHGSEQPAQRRPKPAQPVKPVAYATDTEKHEAYRMIFQMKRFALSPAHRANLLKRGLSERATRKYRTIPEAKDVAIPEYIAEMYNAEGLDAIRKNLPCNVSREEALFGLTVGVLLEKKGKKLGGVPGFYKLGTHWALYTTPGILIPTKNEKGQIVCCQVRKDSGKIRYMTLSQKSLPEAAQDGISRVHVVSNLRKGYNGNFRVLLTEGPLKADVICALSKEPVMVLAIQGINNTSALPQILRWLKKNNVQTVYNCLDMDRITNKNVRAGSVELRCLMHKAGFQFPAMVWDEQSCNEQLRRLGALCAEHSVARPKATGNPFVDLAKLCIALEEADVEHSKKGSYWPDRSKGYDDWLWYQTLNA